MTENRQDQRPFRRLLKGVIEVVMFYWTWLEKSNLANLSPISSQIILSSSQLRTHQELTGKVNGRN